MLIRIKRRTVCFLVSLLSLIISAVVLKYRWDIFQSVLASQLRIKRGTPAYEAFVETSFPVLTKFYFFDMINPRELFYRHEKPVLEERGPYTFRESQRKINIKWHPNGTVSYQKEKFWYFERDLSVGPLSDIVTTINLPVVSAAEVARGNYFMEWGISDMLSALEAEIFVKRTIGELLFEGYEDSVMEIGSAFGHGQGQDKFGWFYGRNGTSWSDGDIEMRTGEDDVESLGEIVSWNGENRTEAYGGECGRVRGSAEGLFPPGVAEMTDSLSFYSTDLCRPLLFTKSGPSSVHGIPVTKFQLDPSNFANSSSCPDNQCYNNNLPTGVQNVTLCKTKSPVYVSRPHFYLADQSYLKQFQHGLSPDPEKHDSVFWLEPMSSIPLKVNIRLQLNVLLRKVEGIEYLFKDLRETMFPVFWFESISDLPEDMSGPVILLTKMPTILQFSSLLTLIISAITLLSVLISRVRDNYECHHTSLKKTEHEIIMSAITRLLVLIYILRKEKVSDVKI